MTNEELERAVERLTADLTANHAMTLGGAVVRTSDLRLLLSERAELLAAVERMRGALEPFAKAATLFDTGEYMNRDASIYGPAAGEEYYLNSGHLLDARAALTTGEGK